MDAREILLEDAGTRCAWKMVPGWLEWNWGKLEACMVSRDPGDQCEEVTCEHKAFQE